MENENAPENPESVEDLLREIIGLLQQVTRNQTDIFNQLVDVEGAVRHS